MYQFIGKWHDLIAALLLTLVIVLAGVFLAYYYNPVWLNRAGSLIIIMGVILAVNRFHELFEERLTAFFDKKGDRILARTVELIGEKVERPLSPEELIKVKEITRKELVNDLKSVMTERKEIFRYFEIWLVVLGTFLNGFGDYLVCSFKSCGT